MPAVSIKFKLSPRRRIFSSSVSRVVPAISVTIARSSPSSTFIRDDFPAFGLPKITVLIPSVMIRPLSNVPIDASSREICSGSSSADSIKAIS